MKNLTNILYAGLLSLPLLSGCEKSMAPASSKEDPNYLEGIVVEEFTGSKTLPLNHFDYVLKVETEKGVYTFSVWGGGNPKPINTLAAAIGNGDKIRFSISDNAHFDNDRIGYCSSNRITLLEKKPKTYSGPLEQEKK